MEFNIRTKAGVGDFIFYPFNNKINFEKVRDIRIVIKGDKHVITYNDKHPEEKVFDSVGAVLGHLKDEVDVAMEKYNKNDLIAHEDDEEDEDDEEEEKPRKSSKMGYR